MWSVVVVTTGDSYLCLSVNLLTVSVHLSVSLQYVQHHDSSNFYDLVPPQISGPSGQHFVAEYSSLVMFSYIVYPSTSYALSWRRNYNIFNGNARISILHDRKTLVLRFPSREDSGNYTLMAGNRAGNRSIELELIIPCMACLWCM